MSIYEYFLIVQTSSEIRDLVIVVTEKKHRLVTRM